MSSHKAIKAAYRAVREHVDLFGRPVAPDYRINREWASGRAWVELAEADVVEGQAANFVWVFWKTFHAALELEYEHESVIDLVDVVED